MKSSLHPHDIIYNVDLRISNQGLIETKLIGLLKIMEAMFFFFFGIFTNGIHFCDCLFFVTFCSLPLPVPGDLEEEVLPNWNLLYKKRICSMGSKEKTPFKRGAK